MTEWNKRFYLTAMSVFESVKTRSSTEDLLPEIYKEAIQSIDRIEWKKLMKDEFDFLVKNHIWVLMSEKEVFSNQHTLNEKWVYRIKKIIKSNQSF